MRLLELLTERMDLSPLFSANWFGELVLKGQSVGRTPGLNESSL
jgi:hypothetical protein